VDLDARDYAFLAFGSLRVDIIEMAYVLDALKPVWTAKPAECYSGSKRCCRRQGPAPGR
jgi:hypothetical protein